jgi:hypothetical protein
MASNRDNVSIGEFFGNYPMAFTVPGADELVDNDTAVGVELEIEGIERYDAERFPHKFWNIYHDGSLRDGGREFIMGSTINTGRDRPVVIPFKGVDIVRALKAWDEYLKYHIKRYGAPTLSKRCSSHVHIDVRDLSFPEISSLIILYVIMERTLFTYVGENRKESIYCLPFFKSKYLGEAVGRSLATRNLSSAFQSLCTKYDAMNLNSISGKGSVEFRMHPGCFDYERILQWVNILLSLKKYAKVFNTDELKDLPESISNMGIDGWLDTVFGDYAAVLKTEHTYTEVFSGIRDAQEIIFHTEITQYEKGIIMSTKWQTLATKSHLFEYAKKHGLEGVLASNLPFPREKASSNSSSKRSKIPNRGFQESIPLDETIRATDEDMGMYTTEIHRNAGEVLNRAIQRTGTRPQPIWHDVRQPQPGPSLREWIAFDEAMSFPDINPVTTDDLL